MKKFLSDVLIDCNLTVSGSSSLGAATGVTVDASDNSNKIATTAWVKGLGFSTANTTYLLDVPANTTNFRLIGSDSSTDTITLSAAGASSITRVSASELRITSSDTIDYISGVSFASNTITFTGTGNAFSGTIDLSVYLTQAEGDARYLSAYSETDTLDTVTSRDGVTTNTIGVGTVNIIGTTAGQELLTVDGTFGRLFTVTDDLSESLFSVNTVAGLPALEVFADNSIKLGAFASPITIDSDSNINIPGVITASGYNDANWNAAYNDRIVSAAVSGTSTKTLTLTQEDGGTVTASWTDIEGDQADGYVSTVALNGNSLDFTGTGSGFTGSIDLSGITSSFNAEEVQTVYENIKNVSGSPIQKGTPLAVVPGQTSGNLSDVVPAAADDPARMPAVFIANEDLADEAEGLGVVYGNITGIDTSAFDSGTTVYVAPGGGWTDTKPTGTDLIQNLGIITKSHASNGGGVVMGAGRSNDVPNIANGYAWVGNAQGVATPTLLGSLAYSSATYDNYVSWNLKTNGTQRTTVASGGTLDIVAGTNVSVAYGAGGVVTISSTDTNTDTNNYLTGLSFNTGNGILTATRQGLTDLTVDLDGRYLTSFTETDTLDSVTDRGATTTNAITVGGVDSTGGVNITRDSSNTQLKLKRTTSATGEFNIYTNTDSLFFQNVGQSTYPMVIDANGNVGIGTTSPASLLQVEGSANNVATFKSTDNRGSIAIQDNDTTAYVVAEGGRASVGINSGLDANNININSSGNVGIGTTSPSEKLHVNQGHVKVQSPNVGEIIPPSLTIGQVVNAYQAGISSTGHATVTAASNVYLRVGGSTFALTAKADGNVGIGNTNPGYKLDVAGNIKTDGYYVIGGDDAARIASGSGTGNPVPQEIASFESSVHVGAFIDFTIYSETKEHMRSGTLQLVFNADQVMFNEVNTMDIGDTSPCILSAVINAGVVSVTFETPDPSFFIKYQARTI